MLHKLTMTYQPSAIYRISPLTVILVFTDTKSKLDITLLAEWSFDHNGYNMHPDNLPAVFVD